MNDEWYTFKAFTLFSPQSRALLWFPGHWPQSDKAHYEEHLDRRNMFTFIMLW